MNNVRSKRTDTRYSGADATDYSFNQYAGALKMLGPILGKVSILGALNAAKDAGPGALVAVYNNSGSTAFVKTGDSAVTAPTGGADGIPVPPNAYVIVAMGTDTHIISNAATTFGYKIQDDLNYNAKSGLSTI